MCCTTGNKANSQSPFLQRIEDRKAPKHGYSNDFALSPMKYCEIDQINIKRTTIILTNHINNQKPMKI